jgi:hypothetical protein
MLKLEVNHLKEKEKFKQEIQEHLKYDGKFTIILNVLKILLTSNFFVVLDIDQKQPKAPKTPKSPKNKNKK